MDLEPDQWYRLTALAVFAVAAVDLGMAFLMRGESEGSGGGPRD